MRISELEIFGFKSFAQKVVLKFPENITAIVGPNGTGKSNLVEAFRWALGEQSTKHIRVSEPKEIIFSGSGKAAPLSVAWVRLTLTDTLAATDMTEVEFQRKIDRSGEIGYFLNRQPARLKEIVYVLSKIRSGSKGLTIVNQGAADVFLRASPEERYVMLSEMIGTKVLELKKNEAVRRLVSTEEHLKEAKIRLREITPQLKYFKKEQARARRRQELLQQKEELQREYGLRKLFVLEEQMRNYKGELQELAERQSSVSNDLQRIERQLQEKPQAHSLDALRQREVALLEERSMFLSELVKQKRQPHASKVIVNDLLNEIYETLCSLMTFTEVEHVKGRLQHLIQKIEPVVKKNNDSLESDQKNESSPRLEEIDTSLEELRKVIKKEEEASRHVNEEFQKRLRAHTKLQEEAIRLTFDHERIKREMDAVATKVVKLKESTGSKEPLSTTETELRKLEGELQKIEYELMGIGDVDQELLKEAEALQSHADTIEREVHDLETSMKDIQEIIRHLEEQIRKEFKIALAKINEGLQMYFRNLFGGGRCVLSLNGDKEVHVSVDHPTKRIKTLESLSGGEKALISIALIFALVKASQPPFLILDEIDAALDELNSQKFANILKELAKETQFIIVTHNRALINAADVLYGMSMDNGGVTKVVSLKLSETEEAEAD